MSSLSLDDIKDADEEFWRWVFREKDGNDHPLKISNGGKAQIQKGRILIIAGAIADDKEKKIRSLKIPNGVEYIFVPADNCVYTNADNDGKDEKELIAKANTDMASGRGNVTVDGNSQEVNLLPGHSIEPPLRILERIDKTGNSGKGEGWKDNMPPGHTIAASACHYAIIRATSLKKGAEIKITGEESSGIDVTYTVE